MAQPPSDVIRRHLFAGHEKWNGLSIGVEYPLDIAGLFPDGILAVSQSGFASYIFQGTVLFDGLRVPAGFSFGAVHFRGGASFRRSVFDGDVPFDNARFEHRVTFELAKFRGRASFRGAQFNGESFFIATRFYGDADFASCHIVPGANLSLVRCVFGGEAKFDSAHVQGSASFGSSRFCKQATFVNAQYEKSVTFSNARFYSRAQFNDAQFGNANFDASQFRADVDFSTDESRAFSDATFADTRFESTARFWKRKFKGITVFRGAHFGEPPEFFNASLPDEADFEHATYGAITKENAWFAAPAYRALKLAMSKLQHHRAEALFFAKEMRARRYIEEAAFQRGLFAIYGLVSDFGQSVMRPAVGLLVAFLIFLAAYVVAIEGPLIWQCLSDSGCKIVYDGSRARAFLVLAFAGLVPFFEFAKQAAASAAQIVFQPRAAPLWLPVTELLENVVSTFFLFLLGLALRNLFRLR